MKRTRNVIIFVFGWIHRIFSRFRKGRAQKRLCEVRVEFTDQPIIIHVIKVRDEASAAELAMSLSMFNLLLKCFEIRVESADEFPEFVE